MKVVLAVIILLFVMFGMGFITVVKAVSDAPYNCTVTTEDSDGNKQTRTGTFTGKQLESVLEHGGGMLGAHVKMMSKQDGSYTSPIHKQEEAFSGSVVCKKSVSI